MYEVQLSATSHTTDLFDSGAELIISVVTAVVGKGTINMMSPGVAVGRDTKTFISLHTPESHFCGTILWLQVDLV